MATTILLDLTNWDLVIDADGNIAAASDPYSVAQDVASALRLFLGELWYDTALGVPYFEDVLGKRPSLQQVKSLLKAQAETVPGVLSATVFISSIIDRRVSGQVKITTTTGQTQQVNF